MFPPLPQIDFMGLSWGNIDVEVKKSIYSWRWCQACKIMGCLSSMDWEKTMSMPFKHSGILYKNGKLVLSVFEHDQNALFLLKGRRRLAAFRAHCQWRWRMALKGLIKKHRKNCECCHHHSLFKGHNVNVKSVVPNCQKCYQCLKCQVSGHKYRGLPFEGFL